MMAAIAVTAGAWVIGPAAGASPSKVGPSVTSTVGHYLIRGVGRGPTFDLKACSTDSVVACQVNGNLKPRNATQLWCLGPTAPTDAVSVTYLPKGTRAPIQPTTLTVRCKAPHLIKMTTPNDVSFLALSGVGTPSFTVTNCTTDLTGTSCTFSGETVTIACQLGVFANTLPATGTATVTLGNGPSVIDGKTIAYPFECKA